MAESASISMSDKFEIMELITRYNHAVDGGDPDGVAQCFVPDGTFRGRSGYFAGREELRRLGMTLTRACFPRHITSNVLITGRSGEPNVADVKSHLLFYEVKPEGFNFKTSGIYTDVVEKRDGQWKFRSRVMTLDVATPL